MAKPTDTEPEGAGRRWLRAGLTFVAVRLMGFLPSWPVAIPAANRLTRRGRLWQDLLWAVAAFTLFFWSAGCYLLLRAS